MVRLVLLHGAGLGKWIWDRVLPDLAPPAEAIDLPGRSDGRKPGEVTLQECVDSVRRRLQDGRAIVVGHSFSAEVALAAAAQEPSRVAGVVLIGGLVPESGRPFLSLLPFPQRLLLKVIVGRSRNGVRLPQSLVRAEYCNDLDEASTAQVLSRIVPEVPRLYLDPVHWASLPAELPRFYVRLTNDKSVSSRQQEAMIRRIASTGVESLATGHLPMLATPRECAAALNRIAAPLR